MENILQTTVWNQSKWKSKDNKFTGIIIHGEERNKQSKDITLGFISAFYESYKNKKQISVI